MILQFALRLLTGLGITWLLMPRAAVTVGFFRIQMLVALGLSVLGAMTAGQYDPEGSAGYFTPARLRWICIALAICAFCGSVLWMLGRRRAGFVCCALIASGAGLGTLGMALHDTPFSTALWIANELSSSWLLGGAVCAMLLGHWHLTATSMSLAPLTRLTQLLLAAAAVRGVLAGIGLLTREGSPWIGVTTIWLILRWAAGIMGPIILGAMVLRILKYRNTQSATGVLFAGVILVFIGETTAALLGREFHWPL
jgi:hypothetical protein